VSADRTEDLLAELDALLAEGEQPDPDWDATYDAATWTPALAEDDRPVDVDSYGNPLVTAWDRPPHRPWPLLGMELASVERRPDSWELLAHYYLTRDGQVLQLLTVPRRPRPAPRPPVLIVDEPVQHSWLQNLPAVQMPQLEPAAEPRIPTQPERPIPLPAEYHGTLTIPEDLPALVRRPDVPYARPVQWEMQEQVRQRTQEYLARALDVPFPPAGPTWQEQVEAAGQRIMGQWREVMNSVTEHVMCAHDWLRDAGVIPEEEPVDPRARALHRGTGPARPSGQNAHAPRHHGARQ